MRITNLTKNTVLAENAALADTLLSRMKGLLGRDELKPGEALILRPGNSIHTFFMRFSIDVLFVDKHNRVIKALSNVRPFRLSGVYFRSSYVIELPCGTISATNTSASDTLSPPD